MPDCIHHQVEWYEDSSKDPWWNKANHHKAKSTSTRVSLLETKETGWRCWHEGTEATYASHKKKENE